jgi:hypothetical protein
LNISGTSIEKLPENIMKFLPNLNTLLLNQCKALVFLPLSLAALNHIQVADCSSLIYPPASAQQTPQKVLEFLRDVDPSSEPWRRIKVLLLALPMHQPRLSSTILFSNALDADCVSGQRS